MKNDKKIGAIIIGNHVQALGIIRSLGKRKIPVYLLHDKILCIGRFSKYLTKFIKMPDLEEESIFLEFMINLAKKIDLEGGVLIATNDTAVKFLSKNKNALEEYYRVPTPAWDIAKFALNKELTYSIAKKIGLFTPKIIHLSNFKELEESDIEYPVILKGAIGSNFYKKTGSKAFKADSLEELKEIYKKISDLIDFTQVIVQEEIPGSTDLVYSFCSFFKNNEPLAVWTGRKIREHPMGLGTGTLAESVYVPEIVDQGLKLLRAINYHGVSEIEFKRDPRDDKFKLIEMNARTWLWVSLAVRAGMDFPYMLYKDAIGEEMLPQKPSFKEGLKWIHLYTDLAISLKEMLNGKIKMSDYLKSIKGEKEFAVLKLSDPLPFIAETMMLPYLLKTR